MRICLSMIVKNEAEVIERCLASVKPHIHAWKIIDTGSTDGTQEIVRKYLADLPGCLIERPWVDFATNRNQALEHIQEYGEYAFFIDADEVLEVDNSLQVVGAPGYFLEVIYNNLHYHRLALANVDTHTWSWKGVIHEALYGEEGIFMPVLPNARIHVHTDGARSKVPDAIKFGNDALTLEKALQEDPSNTRYWFYLAQSYRDSGQLEKALTIYYHRAQFGGWEEEVYISLLEIAKLSERLRRPVPTIRSAYLDAHQYRPSRAEALRYLARYHRGQGWIVLANMFDGEANKIPYPTDRLFVDTSCYKEK